MVEVAKRSQRAKVRSTHTHHKVDICTGSVTCHKTLCQTQYWFSVLARHDCRRPLMARLHRFYTNNTSLSTLVKLSLADGMCSPNSVTQSRQQIPPPGISRPHARFLTQKSIIISSGRILGGRLGWWRRGFTDGVLCGNERVSQNSDIIIRKRKTKRRPGLALKQNAWLVLILTRQVI